MQIRSQWIAFVLMSGVLLTGRADSQEPKKLPRVLILGDSISLGYTDLVRKQLQGTAEVLRPKENCQHTAYGLTRIKAWLGNEKWDVIHFNWGIWDTHMLSEKGTLIANEAKFDGVMRIRHTPEKYRENLAALVETMEKTGAKLIWASTTPIMSRTGKRFDDIKTFNTAAGELMKERRIAVNDLYSLVLPHAKAWQSGDKVHFNALGNENLARQVSDSIRNALGQSPAGDPEARLRQAVSLYASFDKEVRMDFGVGDPIPGTRSIDPADNKKFLFEKGFDPKFFQIAKARGIVGGCLEADLPPRSGRLYFSAKGNVAYGKNASWGGAISVWVNTDPNQMLRTPFCDPVLITQKGFNNGSIWAHFNDAKPRALQSGTYPSIPEGLEPIAEEDPKAPLTRLKNVPFKAGEWHHIVLAWDRFNTGRKDGTHTLWIDGKKIGQLKDHAIAMDWDLEKTRVYFAVNLVGLLDELAVFSRPLTDAEVTLLYQRPGVLQSLKK